MKFTSRSRLVFVAVGCLLAGGIAGYFVRGEALAWRSASAPPGFPRNTPLTARAAAKKSAEPERSPAFVPAEFDAAVQAVWSLQAESPRDARLREIFQKLDASNIVAAVEHLRSLGARRAAGLMEMAGARWAEFDAPAALESEMKRSYRKRDHELMSTALQTWILRDPEAAGTWLDALPEWHGHPEANDADGLWSTRASAVLSLDPPTAVQFFIRHPVYSDFNACRSLFEQWSASDPRAAGDAARALQGELQIWARQGMAAGLSRGDPQAAIQWAEEIADPFQQGRALKLIARPWAETDPRAALEWARGLRDLKVRAEAVEEVISEWIDDDPAAAQTAILALPPGEERNAALATGAQAISVDDLPAAIRLMEQIPALGKRGKVAGQLIFNLMDGQANTDMKDVAKLYEMVPPDERSSQVQHIAGRWAREDLAGALAWAAALPEGELRASALDAATQRWVGRDPKAALNWLLEKDPNPRNEHPLESALSNWAEHAPEAAMAWTFALPAGKVRDALSAEIVTLFARSDPAHAAEIFATKLSREAQSAAVGPLTGDWMHTDPIATAAWAEGLPDERIRSAALDDVAGRWATDDPEAAAHWLERLRPGDDRDTAIAAFVKAVGANDPALASGWLPKIRDAAAREDAAESFAEDWIKLDANGARKWIAATRFLSPEKKRELLDAKGNRGQATFLD